MQLFGVKTEQQKHVFLRLKAKTTPMKLKEHYTAHRQTSRWSNMKFSLVDA